MATTSDTDPLSTVYRQAFQCYQKLYDDGKLKEKQFALIKGQNTIEEVLNTVRNAETKNKSERNAVQRVLRRTSESLVGKLCRFEGVVSTAIQANPNISALVWGGVKFVLVVTDDTRRPDLRILKP
ncbi:hypothetical protein BDD12DRAFT_805864 [Trichophaea hybrida]|nr:hypothetical protein BDD12DRAFT_805864 [Trichophaea hybrida]